MTLLNHNPLPAGAASMVGHLVANEALAGSNPVASSKLGGNLEGIGPAALGARGRGTGGCAAGFQPAEASSILAARSMEVYPALPGSFYVLGRPVDWCSPVIYGQGTGCRSVSKTDRAGFEPQTARQACRHQDREERF